MLITRPHRFAKTFTMSMLAVISLPSVSIKEKDFWKYKW